MKAAILGAGGIGSTFAVQLARAGHDVTVIARGARLAQLEAAGGIALASGELVAVPVSAALPEGEPFDLVLVTVLASQVDVVLPALAASKARRIMFMFNTFEPLDRLRDAVGAERFTFGFPSIIARVDERGALHTDIQKRGLQTTVTDADLARAFTDAGIPTVVTPDMPSWLRAHAAAIVPFMLAVASAHGRGRGIEWREAGELAAAMGEGFALVKRLGHAIIPSQVALLGGLPQPARTLILWGATRSAALRASGAAGVREPRALLDAMLAAAAPDDLPALRRVRPAEA
jgi:2-dehydropantoate 2-reductase